MRQRWWWRGWPRKRAPQPKPDGSGGDAERRRFVAIMQSLGYVEWATRPPTDDVVECRRIDWGRSKILRLTDLHPSTNAAGLYWRPVGGVIDIDGEAVTVRAAIAPPQAGEG